ncbi:hypothetical protein B0T19DRAFT_462233 [Cercophora scortea]|uniref:Zn(2)-C6 fungal-type domain-containing protein n=1 Tax=Cercophora scortea TaxID=314031 RepID=A0AAE0IPE3_9PEZI|nr:hypothetical protein B0T19DRAFT_462233 [Cercophora scortea]
MPLSEATASGSSPQTTLAVFGCENCRSAHLKCDRVIPACGRCKKARKKCKPMGIRIREVNKTNKALQYAKSQKWVKPPRKLTFINETKSVVNGALNLDSDVEDSDPDPEPDPDLASSHGSDRRDSLQSPVDRTPTSASYDRGSASSTLALGARSPTDRFILRSKPIWPMTNPEEARLLDLCDERRMFEAVVPERAGSCPTLLNAILALSHRHLSHVNEEFKHSHVDDASALGFLEYETACVPVLMQMHNNPVTSTDEEDLFAAIIILRVLEEMKADHGTKHRHGYLLGIKLNVERAERYMVPGSLSAASFWVGLRQEIYSAVMNHCQVGLKLVHSLVDQSLGTADDDTWANRAIVHCAQVLNFCFGDHGNLDRWDQLNTWSNEWRASVPSSWTPKYVKEFRLDKDEDEDETDDGDERFSEIWYNKGCHVIGMQHHLLAQLFLVGYDPRCENMGGALKAVGETSTKRMQALVRKICSIGLGNQWSPPGMFTACMAIAAFGDRFSHPRDQEAVLEILRKTERDHARPTEEVQAILKKAWGWV